MFTNVGKKIKSLAKGFCVLAIAICIYIGGTMMSNNNVYTGFFVAVGGSFASWISSFFLYGFGEIIENIVDINNRVNNIEIAVLKDSAESMSTACAASSWTCACGRIHANYESSCICGLSKSNAISQ